MSMSKQMLPTEGSEPVTVGHGSADNGMSLDDAIHEFIRLEARQAELREEKARVLEILLPEAFEVRGQANVSRLQSNDGKQIKVEFKEAFKCDANQLNTAKDLIGDDQFERLFKTEYAPRLRDLKLFLGTKSADERIETAKQIIREGITTVQRSPYVTVEKP